MKTRIILIFTLIMINLNTNGQENHLFLGNYSIQEVCKSAFAGNIPSYIDPIYYEIEIKPSSIDTFDIQFYIPVHLLDTIKAKILNGKVFQIPSQEFLNYDNTSIFFSGDGNIIGDSIEINYRAGGSFGTSQCVCSGVRKEETGINANQYLKN